MTAKKIGFAQAQTSSDDWRRGLAESWKSYFVDTLGLPANLAAERANQEINGLKAVEYCDGLQSKGMFFEDANVLEIGCGHGTMVAEIARRGGKVVGVEPCISWQRIACKRMEELQTRHRATIIRANAEDLPFEDSSFDYVLSLQVLEHVRNVPLAIREMARVLKAEGMAYVSCENYLSFREPHYRVTWFPLLPRFIARIYLQIIGKNPQFLDEHITYTTYPGLIWHFLNAGMWSLYWPDQYQKLNPLVRYVRILIMHRQNIFKAGFAHYFRCGITH